jgi:hypothetical protein
METQSLDKVNGGGYSPHRIYSIVDEIYLVEHDRSDEVTPEG